MELLKNFYKLCLKDFFCKISLKDSLYVNADCLLAIFIDNKTITFTFTLHMTLYNSTVEFLSWKYVLVLCSVGFRIKVRL